MSRAIVIAAGQSGKQGRDTTPPYPVYDRALKADGSPRVWAWKPGSPPEHTVPNGGSWVPAVDPLYAYLGIDSAGGACPSLSCANEYLRLSDLAGGDPNLEFGIIPAAVSGAAIYPDWRPSARNMYNYARMVQMTYAAMAAAPVGSYLAGMTWYEGETFAQNNPSPVLYFDYIGQFLINARASLNGPRLPFVPTILGPCAPGLTCGAAWCQVQSYQAAMAGIDPRVAVCDASQLTLIPTLPNQAPNEHLDKASCVAIGKQWGDALWQLQSQP